MLILLLAGQASVQGYVLCVGENGETALEYAANDTCSPAGQWQAHQHQDEKVSDSPSDEKHCGSCSDLPASIDATTRRHHDKIELFAQAMHVGPAYAPPVPSHGPVVSETLHFQPPLRVSQAILSLRTVVLLV